MIKKDKRALTISIFFSMLLSICVHIGYAVDKTGGLMVSSPLWYVSFLCIWGLCTAVLYFFLAHGMNFVRTGCREKASPLKIPGLRAGVCAFGCMIICWIPVFLAEYPGFFVYDASDEYVEVATRTFTTHHPLAHVLLLGGSVCAGHKLTGDFNVGIALYMIFQMAVVAFIFAYVCAEMTTTAGYVLSILWYGIFPTVVMFVLCSAKDTLFAAFLMAAVVLTVKVTGKLITTEAVKNSTMDTVLLGLSLVCMMLLRRNGVYAFLVYAAVLVCVSAVKHRKVLYVALFLIIVLSAYKLTDAGLAAATHASDDENQEILTVPIQQLARTWSVYGDEMEKEDLDTLYEILPEDVLRHYTPCLSDPVKAGFDNEAYAANKGRYIKLWWKLFREHPLSYINAWLNTSYGFYYPFGVVNVYAGHEVYTFTYTESSYFGYEVEEPGERHSLIPVIDAFYRWLSLDSDIQKMPVISLLFSMGAMFMVYMICGAFLFYKRRTDVLTAMSLPAAVWLTLLLGPTYLPRYTVFLWFMLPYVLHESFGKDKK